MHLFIESCYVHCIQNVLLIWPFMLQDLLSSVTYYLDQSMQCNISWSGLPHVRGKIFSLGQGIVLKNKINCKWIIVICQEIVMEISGNFGPTEMWNPARQDDAWCKQDFSVNLGNAWSTSWNKILILDNGLLSFYGAPPASVLQCPYTFSYRRQLFFVP